MSRAVHNEVDVTPAGVNRRLAFAVFAPAIMWALHEWLSVAIVGRQCTPGDTLATWQWISLATLSVVALGIGAAAAITAFGVFRHSRAETGLTHAEGWSRAEFIALFALFVSCLLFLNMIFFGVVPLVLEPCMRAI